jgi:hypothetical protein
MPANPENRGLWGPPLLMLPVSVPIFDVEERTRPGASFDGPDAGFPSADPKKVRFLSTGELEGVDWS